jgi:MFS transporter, DHA1 family, multidrug resistance protein
MSGPPLPQTRTTPSLLQPPMLGLALVSQNTSELSFQYWLSIQGPLILGFIVPVTSWRWTQYVSLMLMLAAFLFGIGMPETCPREIVRTRSKRAGRPHTLPKAESGVTLAEMAKITIVDPLIMLTTEPIVIMSSLLLGANFGFLFQWFITVPVALGSTYSFTVQCVGLHSLLRLLAQHLPLQCQSF